MTSIREIGTEIERRMSGTVRSLPLGELLVSQAKRRIASGGDSSMRYPDLWNHPKSYRRGGQPLRDTGRLMNSLFGETVVTDDTITARLKTNESYVVGHQEGFKTNGPNFIPLTLKAKRTHRPGMNPKDEGLIPGVDYVMAWGGVTVPARPIFSLPPEDVSEIVDTVRMAVKGQANG